MKKWVEFDLKIINRVSIFQDFFYHKQGQSFKARAAPPYPNLGQVPPRELLLLLQFRLTLSQPLMLNYNVCVVKIAFSLSSTQDLNYRLVLSLKRLYPTIYCGMSGPAELLWKCGGGGGWIVTQSGGKGWKRLFLSNCLKFPKKLGGWSPPPKPLPLRGPCMSIHIAASLFDISTILARAPVNGTPPPPPHRGWVKQDMHPNSPCILFPVREEFARFYFLADWLGAAIQLFIAAHGELSNLFLLRRSSVRSPSPSDQYTKILVPIFLISIII